MMRNDHYILSISGDPIPEPDIMKWAQWFGTEDRTVARTELPGDVVVSTVFLGLDNAFGVGEPQLFETMIFGGALADTQDRYATRNASLNGHAYYVERAREAL